MAVKAMVLLVTENLMGRSGSEAMGGDKKMAIGRYEIEGRPELNQLNSCVRWR